MNSDSFLKELNEKTEWINRILYSYLPEEEGEAGTLARAMNYSLKAGGKRLRPMLLWETYRMFGGNERAAEPFMAAIELIHTHSLVHDDLPALDNDDYRRGKLTTHKVFGEAMGVLAGAALLNYAYEKMAEAFFLTEHPERAAQAMKVMSGKSGLYGMLGGQSVDVENDGKPLSRETLDYIYEKKTSALIEASMVTGAVLAGAAPEQVRRIEEAGRKIGLAFQIRDDILDVTSTDEELGKPVHSDEKNHKVTYVTLEGVPAAEERVRSLTKESLNLLESTGSVSSFLRELVASLAGRKY